MTAVSRQPSVQPPAEASVRAGLYGHCRGEARALGRVGRFVSRIELKLPIQACTSLQEPSRPVPTPERTSTGVRPNGTS
jgi:hypothetical protein